MPDVCPACGMFALDNLERRRDRVRCTACGHEEPVAILPLFVVTGASGSGKTAVARALQRIMPEADVFESDILYDPPMPTVDTTTATVDEVAARIRDWVREHLACEAGG